MRHRESGATQAAETWVGAAPCKVCGEPMQWIDCPTGGWWSHLEHPADDHDGEAPAPDHSDGQAS